MTGVNPTSQSIHPPLPHDALGAALITALSREPGPKLKWSLPIVLIGGLATAGLLPLVILLLRFRTFAISEKFHLEHVNEWMQNNDLATDQLNKATRQLSDGWPMLVLIGGTLSLAGFVLAFVHVLVLGLDVWNLWSMYTLSGASGSTIAYMVTIICAYALLYIAARQHARLVRRFVNAFEVAASQNGAPCVTGSAGLTPSPSPLAEGGGEGLRVRRVLADPLPDPLPEYREREYSNGAADGTRSHRTMNPMSPWMICGVALLAAGCLWGLPMMLAAGAHRRYINDLSPRVRSQIGERIASMMQRRDQPLVASSSRG